MNEKAYNHGLKTIANASLSTGDIVLDFSYTQSPQANGNGNGN